MTNQPLRRSRRGKQQSFGPGDRVEVLRDSNVTVGRLVRMIDDDDDDEQMAHWMVSFEGEADEARISAKNIGRLVSEEEDPSEEGSGGGASRSKPASALALSKGKKTVSAKKAQPPSSRSKAKLVNSKERVTSSAMEFRSTRSGRKQPLLNGIRNTSKKRCKAKDDGDAEETVVKVKMLTGTLYLYRGLNPRAEFVRVV